jgi:hypothetical protein
MYDYLATGGIVRWSPSSIVLTESFHNAESVQNHWYQSKKQYLLALGQMVESELLHLYKLYEIVYAVEYKDEPPYSKIKMLFEQTI